MPLYEDRATIMKKQRLFLLGGLALALTGCVITSVYPFYTERDLIFESKLLGTWEPAKDSHSKEKWVVNRAGATSYKVLEIDTSTNSYEGHLFKLAGDLFLDLTPTERKGDFLPPHYLIRII